MNLNKKGFTLIELIVIIAIIAILAVGTMSLIGQGPVKRSRDGRRQADLEMIRSALELYKVDDPNSYYKPDPLPACGTALTSADGLSTYIAKTPCDPLSTATSYYYDQTGGGFTYVLGACLELGTSDATCPQTCTGTQAIKYCISNP